MDRTEITMIHNEKGIALIIVLWVLTLLTVIAGQFCYSMRTEITITKNFRDETTGYYLARAGITEAMARIIAQQEEQTRPRPRQPMRQPKDASPAEEQPWRVNAEIPPVNLGDGFFSVRIDNESGKFNINLAEAETLRMMLAGFDLSDEERNIIVDSIRDWRDKDTFHRTNGAEDDYYMSLPQPYRCTNGPFRSINELLLVRGVTRELFDRGLKDIVTIHADPVDTAKNKRPGWEANRKRESIQKININAASVQVLRSLPNMTDEAVAAIIEYRRDKDILSKTELYSLVERELYSTLAPMITTEYSSYYTITATGWQNGATIKPTLAALVQFPQKGGFRIIQWLDYVE